MRLPPDTGPHASSKRKQNTTDNEVLREIFRSSSSVRGYQTASESMHLPSPKRSSFDVNFKFGSKDSEAKPPSRLEQLGSHIKQRISEGRLSMTGSGGQPNSKELPQNHDNMHPSPLGMDNVEASVSQQSNGLLELLMSRTRSEGGYDSDAKSIRTTMLKANDGTINLGPSAAKETTNSLDISAAAPPSPSHSQRDDVESKDAIEKALIDIDFLSTPGQTIFTEAVLAGKDSSPIIALQGLSTGISNGTIKLPTTFNSNSTLNHVLMKEKDQAGVVSSASPGLSYSADEQIEILSALKRLGDTVTAAQMDSVDSNSDDDVRASIVSNLDPTFIEFISKFAELDPKINNLGASDPDSDPGAIFAGGEISTDIPSHPKSDPQKKDIHSSRDLASRHDSDQLSVHLYNMRISQNLASPSLVAVSSRPTTSHTTISRSKRPSLDVAIPAKRQSTSGHLSSRVTAEHNRRPSDPQTRRLFELGHQAENMRAQWKTVTSFGSGVSGLSFKPNRVGDDRSSFYWSDGELGPANNSLGEPPKRNINSLAIGGRSGSVSLPVSSSMKNMGKPSETEEGTWFGRRYLSKASDGGHAGLGISSRSRSTSMPDRARLQPHQPSTRQTSRKSTEENESLSEISTRAIEDARRERLTEISAQTILDSHNEQMSEINHSPTFETRNWNFSFGSAVSSDRRQLSNISAHSLNARTHWQGRKGSGSGASHDLSSLDFLDSATDMWQRSFRQAVAEPLNENVVGFLAAPKYDRDGRRRKSKTSSFSNLDRDEVLPTESHLQVNSKHAKLAFSPDGDVEAQQTLLQPSPALTENNNERKKSFLDIGRRFTVSIPGQDCEIRPRTTTPLKDIFGL